MIRDRLPHLAHFFGAYFHEDWDFDDPDDRAVVDRFLRCESRERVDYARVEINHLLAMPLADEELSEVVFRDLGCYYTPEPDVPMRQWLRSVGDLLGQDAS